MTELDEIKKQLDNFDGTTDLLEDIIPKLITALEVTCEALEQYSYGDDTPAATQALAKVREILGGGN